MSKNNILLNTKNREPGWVTIREAVKIANKLKSIKITESDIYRHALNGDIVISIYFQSPIILRKIKTSDNKLKLRPIGNSLPHRICLLDKNCFLSGRDLILSTEGEYIFLTHKIIDTSLTGYEYVLVQRLLAHSLSIPLPITGANNTNYGISVSLSGEIFQTFEKVTWQERITKQVMRLPKNIIQDVDEINLYQKGNIYFDRGYFPIHDLPKDACFVIRYTELEKLINMPVKNGPLPPTSTRISTPLSRLFWLACKHNEAISPLIKQPYKLLSIFEQWAATDGITDRLSGDTLKTALERGSPSSMSP